MPSPTSTLTLRALDLADAADEELFRRAHDAVRVPADVALLGDRSAPWSADEHLAEARFETSWDTTLGVTLDGDRPVGVWGVFLPLADNRTVAYLENVVTPGERRRGIGRRQLAVVTERARAAGRTVLQTFEGSPADPGAPDPCAAFARAHGFVPTLPALRNDLDLDSPGALDRALAALDAEVAGADLADYRLVTWWDRCPDEHLADRALLRQRMSTDAPQGDMVLEEEVWDGDRVRELERVAAEAGSTTVETCALHVPSGRLVAFTVLQVARARPQHADQEDTLVLREHRGHRLGMWVKAANLRALAERVDVRRVTTHNAASNAPMLRVNEAMGFRPVLRTSCWTKHLDTTGADA